MPIKQNANAVNKQVHNNLIRFKVISNLESKAIHTKIKDFWCPENLTNFHGIKIIPGVLH